MQSVFKFLADLKENNNREWFANKKSIYDSCHQEMIELADLLLAEMNTHDAIETISGKKSLHRIYRDVRFSKDKSPYKSNWSGTLKRASANRRGSYYYHLEPGNSFLAGGFWGPNKEDLKLIRCHIAQDSAEYREIINTSSFKKTFSNVQGEQLKKTPKGFDIENPDVDLLRCKQFVLKHDLTDDEVFSSDFSKSASNIFKQMRPYFDIMTEFLTTDLDGIKTI
jgi:uncharacterized protein (TIGR02453 family)